MLMQQEQPPTDWARSPQHARISSWCPKCSKNSHRKIGHARHNTRASLGALGRPRQTGLQIRSRCLGIAPSPQDCKLRPTPSPGQRQISFTLRLSPTRSRAAVPVRTGLRAHWRRRRSVLSSSTSASHATYICTAFATCLKTEIGVHSMNRSWTAGTPITAGPPVNASM